MINRVSTRLAQTLDIDQIYRIIGRRRPLGATSAARDLEGNEVGRVVFGTHPDDRHAPELPLAGNASVDLRQTHRPLASEDGCTTRCSSWPTPARARHAPLIIAPLVVGAEVIGTLGPTSRPRRFTEAESELLNTLTSQASVAIARPAVRRGARPAHSRGARDTAATINNTLNIDEASTAS